jgi:periplasmic protein TonB
MKRWNTGLGPKNDVFPGMILEEKPIWSGLYESIRDVLFPVKLPALELTSMPVPVVDRMAAKTNPWAVGTATVVNGGILAMIICLGLKTAINDSPHRDPANLIHLLDNWRLPVLAKGNNSGGSGGSRDLIDPIQGRPLKVDLIPLAPPQVPILDNPKLRVDPALTAPPDVKLPENSTCRISVSRSRRTSHFSRMDQGTETEWAGVTVAALVPATDRDGAGCGERGLRSRA